MSFNTTYGESTDSAKAYCENLNESTKAALQDWTSEWMSAVVGFHVYYYLIIVFGGFGNSLIVYIYGRRSQKTTSVQFILFLAVIDLSVCLVIVPLSLHEVYRKFTFFNELVCSIYEYIRHVSVGISCITLGCIAFDRYFAICKPLAYVMHTSRARYMMGVSVVMGMAIELPILFVTGLYRIELPDATLGCSCHWKEQYIGTYVYIIFQSCQLALQLSLAILICMLYTMVYFVVQEREKNRAATTSQFGETTVHAMASTAQNSAAPSNHDRTSLVVRWNRGNNGDSAVASHTVCPEGRHLEDVQEERTEASNSQEENAQTGEDCHRQISVEAAAENTNENQQSPKNERDAANQTPVKANSNSSLVSSDSRTLLHADGDGDNNETSRKTQDSGQRQHTSPQSSNRQDRPQRVPRTRSSLLQDTRVYPTGMPCSSLEPPTTDTSRLRAHNRMRNRYKTAQMLILVTVVFFVTWIPYWIITLVVFLKPEFYKDKAAWEVNILKILRHFYFVNNATNPIIYTFVNRQFRQEVKRLFLCPRLFKCRKQH